MNEEYEGLNEPVQTQGSSDIEYETQPKKKSHKALWLAFGIFLGAGIGVAITMAITKSYVDTQISNMLQDPDAKANYLEYLIDSYYYQDVDEETMQNGAYHGIFESLEDPYSQYFTPEEYAEYSGQVTGNFGGIGAGLRKDQETGGAYVAKVYPDSPSEKGGLKEGDIIISADGNKSADYTLDEFITQFLHGEKGTKVEIVYLRDGKENTVVLERDIITVQTVSYQMLENNIGYIQVSQFTNSTYDDFVAAYEDLESKGMKSVIFDMRENGGGIVDSAVSMLDYLLPEGTVVYTMDKNGKRTDYKSDGDTYKSIPTVVLVNGNTASSAEIFTGAIRDFDYGTIIGTQTYGKGIVQTSLVLQDNSAIKLTTHKYYTPNGECIHGQGITPDIVLDYEFLGGEDDTYSVEFDNQLQKAIEVLSK